MLLKAFAKINLFLAITAKRPDGYHELESILQSVSLFDSVYLNKHPQINLECTHPLVPPDRKNTACAAAQRFFEFTGIKGGVQIKLEKNIPPQSGLGGASADAAAVLIGLNQLYRTDLSAADLKKMGLEAGSDVPFCLTGGRALVGGRGEKITKLKALPETWFVIVKPRINISTAWAYAVYDKLKKQPSQVKKNIVYNSFEDVIFPAYPQIQKIKSKLISRGAVSACLTGSGSAVFGVLKDQRSARAVYKLFKTDFSQVFLAQNVDRGVEF